MATYQQISMFGPTPVVLTPQWGGHGGRGPNLYQINRLLHQVAEGGEGQVCLTSHQDQSTLFWARALKLVEQMESGSSKQYKLSKRGRMLLNDDPYLEVTLGSGAFQPSPLLWVLHWWLVSAPCLSRGVQWLWASAQPSRTTREAMGQQLRKWAKGTASESALKMELKMLLDTYLPNPLAGVEMAVGHGFWDLILLSYDLNSLGQKVGRMKPQVYEKRKGAKARDICDRSTVLPEPMKPTAACLKQSDIEIRGQFGTSVPDLALVYAVLDYAVSQTPQAGASGTLPLSQLLWEDWHSPGLVLKADTKDLEDGLERLRRQGVVTGLGLDWLPDAGGTVLVWTQPLRKMRQQVWSAMIM